MAQQFLVNKEKTPNNDNINNKNIVVKKKLDNIDINDNDKFPEINYQEMINIIDSKFNMMIRKHKIDSKKYKITSKDVMSFINDKVNNINEIDDY